MQRTWFVARRGAGPAAYGLASALLAILASCATEPPRRPNVLHPVDTHRALDLIGGVFDEAGLTVEKGRPEIVNARSLTVDEAAKGHKYGIAFLTRDAQLSLGDALPNHDANPDALVVVDSDSGDRILVLFERDYLTDDLEGPAHSATSIAAEVKIQRDARDFLRNAVRDKWP
jgi:hypothetical protein